MTERMCECWALLAFGALILHAVRRVLLALLAAFVFAGAEAALHVIWISYTAPSAIIEHSGSGTRRTNPSRR
jgi:hypothetical protein